MEGSGNLALAEWRSWPVPCSSSALSASTSTSARREATTESGSNDALRTSARPTISALSSPPQRHQAEATATALGGVTPCTIRARRRHRRRSGEPWRRRRRSPCGMRATAARVWEEAASGATIHAAPAPTTRLSRRSTAAAAGPPPRRLPSTSRGRGPGLAPDTGGRASSRNRRQDGPDPAIRRPPLPPSARWPRGRPVAPCNLVRVRCGRVASSSLCTATKKSAP